MKHKKRKKSHKKKNIDGLLKKVSLFCSAVFIFIVGLFISAYGIGGTDAWIRGSVREFQGMVSPEENQSDFEENEGRSINAKKIEDLGIYANLEGIEETLMVSFDGEREITFMKQGENGVEFEVKSIPSNQKRVVPRIVEGKDIYTTEMIDRKDRKAGKAVGFYTLENNEFIKHWETDTDKFYHHWGDVFKGEIYLPTQSWVNLPNEFSKEFPETQFGRCKQKDAVSSELAILDASNGEIKEIIELIPLVAQIKELKKEIGFYLGDVCHDLLHFNDVRVVKTQQHASYFPGGNVGDLLVSFRNIHMVALLDKDTYKIKWYVMGEFNSQHSPRVTNRGTIIVFDNLGSLPKNGMTRITEVDIKTKKVVGFWEATGDDFLYGKTRGRIQIMNDRIFVQASDASITFELVCKTKYLDNSCEKKVIFDKITNTKNFYMAEFITK